ncbi:MAG: 3-methyl-2-oxobutanoate dehydrogenase subunit VorB [Armatimonadota bacterium]|nr:3-methyl-2-oxobutanoate dehydrogenase subunit VorB [Armatimonadota bacterium]
MTQQGERVFISGNEATAEGGIAGGCRHFFGYPITPQNKIPEYMSAELPKLGGVYLQAESEVAAINMVYGAAAAGARVMTTSSSPGIALMQEGLSYMLGSELPCVLVNMVRGGPGLGNIGPAQSDYWLATRGAGHGDGRCITLTPYSVQELHDFTAGAFDIADRYRNPVMVLADAILANMMEPCALIPRRELPPPERNYAVGPHDPQERERNIVNSLWVEFDAMEAVNERIAERYRRAAEEITDWGEFGAEEPEVLLCAYGISARICESAVMQAEELGIPTRLIRPKTVFPFPAEPIRSWSERATAVVVVEMSMGQFIEDVRLAVEGRCPVDLLARTGGNMPSVGDVVEKIREVALTAGAAGV